MTEHAKSAARSKDFETEFQTARQAVAAATRAASAHIGDLLREHFPTVATLLVNTDEAVIDSFYDGDGQPVDSGTDDHDDLFQKVDTVLAQILSLGKSPEALTSNGWELTHPFPFASFPVRIKAEGLA
ncbi:hypothetical protein [Streptomyces canus]|uniref:hypothetical protein n=1 Tax=Streptomyces canus TaxID=58343 RepID=UPI0030E30E12